MQISGVEVTDEQSKATGQLVVDMWGSNFQTGVDRDHQQLILWAKRSPNVLARRFVIDQDGTITEDG